MKQILSRAREQVYLHIRLVALLLVLILAVIPLFVDSRYILRLITLSLMYVMLSLSLNLLIGYLGNMSMGHAAFWGLGAYTAAILSSRYQTSIVVEIVVAAVITGVMGLLLGLPVMKLKGYYLTIVTMGFCEIIRMVELNSDSLTRGALGISGISGFRIFGQVIKGSVSNYYIILGLVILTAWFVHGFDNSRLGMAVRAIKEDELVAQAMGINVFACRLIVFSLSSIIAGIAGVFYAHFQSMVQPTLFTTSASTQLVTITIFGGLGNIAGSVLGAFSLTLLPEVLRGLDLYRNLMYGIIIVTMMLLKPNGLLGSVNFKYIRQRYELRKEESRKDHSCETVVSSSRRGVLSNNSAI